MTHTKAAFLFDYIKIWSIYACGTDSLPFTDRRIRPQNSLAGFFYRIMDAKKADIITSIIIVIMAVVIIASFLLIRAQRNEISRQADEVQRLLVEIQAFEQENVRLRGMMRQANEALERAINAAEKAHEGHDERIQKIDNAPVDWLMCPVPDDVRSAFCNDCSAV